MVSNFNYVKTEKSNKQARQCVEQKPARKGKTWKRIDTKRQQNESA